LLTYDKGRYRDEIHNSFRRIGYRVESRVLRAVDFGVPQFRERLFFIATKTDLPITFPAPTHCPPDLAPMLGLPPYVTVQEAISDLPTIGEEGEASVYIDGPQTNFQRYARKRSRKTLTLH